MRRRWSKYSIPSSPQRHAQKQHVRHLDVLRHHQRCGAAVLKYTRKGPMHQEQPFLRFHFARPNSGVRQVIAISL
jgi:hypothetical protein